MMSSGVTRRPLPAVVALVALLVLTGLVWWRVLNRGSGSGHPQAGRTGSCATHTSPPPSSSSTLPAPDAVTIVVLNSTNRPGIAGRAQAALVKDGFRSPRPAGNDVAHHNKIKAVALIQYGPTTKRAATLVHYYFPGAVLQETHRKHSDVTISLGKRYRRVASPGRVRAAMRANGIGVTPSPSSSSTRSRSC
jgi:hypothetical protein